MQVPGISSMSSFLLFVSGYGINRAVVVVEGTSTIASCAFNGLHYYTLNYLVAFQPARSCRGNIIHIFSAMDACGVPV